MRKVIKYSSFVLAGIILLIVVLLLLTQTAFFREKLKDRLIIEAEKQLNLHLVIEEMNGPLYNSLELKNVRLLDKETEIGKLASIRLNYHLRALFHGELLIDSLVVDEPEIHLWQEKDSTWNLGSYLKETKDEKTKTGKSLKLKINLRYVAINEGNFTIDALADLIPKKVNDFNLLLSTGIVLPNDIQVNLKELNFKTEEPNLVLNEISGIYQMNDKGIQIDSLKIRTQQSAVNADGRYSEIENMNAEIKASPVDKNELSVFMPSIKLLCSPEFHTKLKTENDVLSATIKLKHKEEEVIAEIKLNPVSRLIENQGPVPFSANLLLHNFSVEHWLDVQNLKTKLEGTVNLDGKNVFDPGAFTNINANLSKSAYNAVEFDTLQMLGTLQNDNINGQLRLTSDFGQLAIKGNIQKFSTERNYSLDIDALHFNVTAFYPEIESTVINGHVNAVGKGFDPAKMSTKASLELTESEIYAWSIDSLTSTLSWKNSNILVDTIELLVPGAAAAGKGSFNIDSLTLYSQIAARIDSLAIINHLVELPVKFDSAFTIVQMDGPVDRLNIQGQADIFNAKAYDAELAGTHANYWVKVHPDSLKIAVQTQSSQVKYMDIPLDSLTADLEYMNNQLDLTGHCLIQDTLELNLKTGMLLGDTMVFNVPLLEANTLLSEYYLKDTLQAALYGFDRIDVKNLLLLDKNDSDFLLSADGTVSVADTNSFHLLLQKFNVEQLRRFIQVEDSVSGVVDADVLIRGSGRNPVVEGSIDVFNPGFGQYSVSSVSGKLNYKDRQGFAELKVPDFGESFYANVSSSFDAYLDSFQFMFSEPDTFNAEVNFEDVNISDHLKDFIENDSLRGVLNAHLTARGDFSNPQIYGNINLNKVRYLNNNLGLDFRDLETSIQLDGNKMSIDTIFIRQKKGLVSISGDLEFDSTIIAGNIISSTLEMDADNFLIAKNKSYEILIDANTFLKTGKNNPEFGGKIKALHSDVFLPAVITREMQESEEDVPMLVEAVEGNRDTLFVSDTIIPDDKKKVEPAMFDNITGRMSVEIPRNTWIRSNEMRVELGGEVDIVKTGPYFELFGEINILRGHYILYGRKLNIDESKIIFNGGEKFNPTFNFTAEYVYRGQDREKRYLELSVTGTLEDPDINFKLDGVSITENDGVSVLLFGTTADNIGFGEQNGLISSIGSNAVASLITSQLSKTLGTQLNLDMIEVTATENWKSAAFVVGKYITNDIFVIYERGFGEADGDEITPETVTVEYELNDILFLRIQSGNSISSGVDVILKFEQGRQIQKKTR